MNSNGATHQEELEMLVNAFPSLSEIQIEQFRMLLQLYPEWNEKINVISRKDIDNLLVNHILHSLAIVRFIKFSPGSRVLDIGTGGGFPGIPLAIFFPDVRFHLIDRVGKKIRVAEDIAMRIGLKNVTFQHGDIGECHEKFDFVVSRAVMPQQELLRLVKKNISGISRNSIPNGLITLKGGDLQEELKNLKKNSEVVEINNYFPQEFFATKKIVFTIGL